jgi:glycosyltransferase involved in cell wall biosynthesis
MKVTISVFGRFHAFYLANELQKHGHLHRLITSYPKFETVKYGIPRDKIISLLPMEVANRLWHKIPLALKKYYNAQYILAETYDHLAAKYIPHDTDLFIGWSSKSLHSIRRAKALGIKTVVERGSSHMLYQKQILKEEYEKYGLAVQLAHPKIVEKELQEYEETDYIEVPSSYVYRTFIERDIPARKIIKSFLGVNLEQFRKIEKEDKTFRIIHCGGISMRKGVHYLLQAFYELNLPDAELWLIGGMSYEIKPFLKKYDNGRVFHKGQHPQNELYKYYSQGSVFCLASIEEGLAMVQPQAMACGLPVICTTNTGGEDIIRDGVDGFIIPIRDVEALKEKILFMYENSVRCAEMGESARLRVKSGFTWDDYGGKMFREYRRIIG